MTLTGKSAWWSVLTVVALANACGSSDGSNATTSSCMISNDGNVPGTDACTDYHGWPASTVMGLCSIPGAQYAASACSRANTIGGCAGNVGSLSYTRWYYPRVGTSPPPTAADVMADCARTTPAETFTAPP